MREDLVTTIQIASFVALIALWLGSPFILARINDKYFDIAFYIGFCLLLLLLWALGILGRQPLELTSCLVGGVTVFFGNLLHHSYIIAKDVQAGGTQLVSRSQLGKLRYAQVIVSVVLAGLLAWFYFLHPVKDWNSFGYGAFTGLGLSELVRAIGRYSVEEVK